MTRKIVIVGGVGGGATVAAQIRRQDKDSQVILFDKGNHIAFSNCGMPYYIGEVVRNRDDLLVETDAFAKKYGVTVHANTEVIAIHRSKKQIQYKNNDGVYTENYDKIILSPGATANVPDFKGLNKERTFTLHTIPDMDNINTFIREKKAKHVAVVGAGFIGLEIVENLKAIGLECTVINRSEQVMKLVDQDMATWIADHLKAKGIRVIVNDGLASFTNDGKTVHLTSGKSIHADMTILAVGIKPKTDLAADASLTLGNNGAITVNAYMQTNDPDIYALGDAIETNDLLTNQPRYAALAWPAHRQAFIIASHLQGTNIPYNGTLGSAVLKVFDLTVAATGHTTASLENLDYSFKEVRLDTYSHAGYYPGSEKLALKILFNAIDGTIYGAQGVGLAGVDKRLAVLSTAIKGNLTVADLPELELAYAPPYSSPKDPVNIIGYKASAMLNKN